MIANRSSNARLKRPVIIGATGSLGRVLHAEARARGVRPSPSGRGQGEGLRSRRILRPSPYPLPEGEGLIATSRSAGPGFIPFDVLRNDLTDVVPDLGPHDCVYLAFGLTSLNWVHAHPQESRMVNVESTLRIIHQALDRGARVVFFSSEQVFDGRKGGYDETSPPNPVTEYGRQKAEVENRLTDRDGDWVIVRTGATVTENTGENCAVEKAYSTLLSAKPKMARDNIFSLTPSQTTVAALLALTERGERGIYHFVAEPPVNRVDLARWILADSRFAKRMRYTEANYADIPFPEPRPLCSYMVGPRTYQRLGMAFPSAREAVRRKVSLLDDCFERKNVR
jgi:dTDP-4-dehydrorhamnose reductase